MVKEHVFIGQQKWTGNLGQGTTTYDAYSRNFEIITDGKIKILGSADPLFRGDAQRMNPEDLFLNALSSCHMLWYFHLCADHGINVLDYRDEFSGVLEFGGDSPGKIKSVILRPKVTISMDSNIDLAYSLHHEANKKCFIANSVNFNVTHEPEIMQSK